MAQTTFGDLTTFGAFPDLSFGSTPMTLMELMGAVLKGLGEVQTAVTAMSTSMPSASKIEKIYGLLGHWTLSGNTMHVYKDDNTLLMDIALTKDKYGNITNMVESE